MSDTRSTLIESATGLVRRQSYSAFSFADLAEAVGLRKASIHHHFPGKEDLGVAMVAAYAERFAEELERIQAEGSSALGRLEAYARLYREALEAGQGCLCGVLASEVAVLPARVQAGIRQYFEQNLRWLERTLVEGRAAGQLRPHLEPLREARTVLCALQGAMLVALTLQDTAAFDHAVEGLLAGLSAASD